MSRLWRNAISIASSPSMGAGLYHLPAALQSPDVD